MLRRSRAAQPDEAMASHVHTPHDGPMRPLQIAALALLSLPLAGCCSMARLFCGPDTSPWVSVDFRTPELAVRTFLEALRRDDPEVLYQALSTRLRAELGVNGGRTQMIWPKIKEQYSGLHMAGYAEIPPIERRDDAQPNRAGVRRQWAFVTIDVEGTKLPLRLVRECFWEVRWTRSEQAFGAPMRNGVKGDLIPNDDAASFLLTKTIEPDEYSIQSVITVGSMTVPHNDRAMIAGRDIESAGIERKWKIDSFLPR